MNKEKKFTMVAEKLPKRRFLFGIFYSHDSEESAVCICLFKWCITIGMLVCY